MDAILFYVVSFLMLFGFAALYIKVTPYNEIEALQQGKLVPILPLLGALLSVTAVVVAAQMIAHNLLGTVLIGLAMGVIQLVVYLGIERLLFGLDRYTNNGENLAINVLLFVVSLCVTAINIVSMMPY